MRLVKVLFVVLNLTLILGSNAHRDRNERNAETKAVAGKSAPALKNSTKIAEIDISGDIKKPEVDKPTVVNKSTLVNNVTHTTQNSTGVENKLPYLPGMEDKVQSGALMRGFFVLLGVTLLLLVYLGLRMFRLSKGHKPPTMVKKYGVLTNRSDVEMRPLPLSEDEDDDTVFEINNPMNR